MLPPLPPAGRSPTVSASTSTPRGPISIKAVRDNARGLVSVVVDAPVPGVVGLRLFDEASGCALDLGPTQCGLRLGLRVRGVLLGALEGLGLHGRRFGFGHFGVPGRRAPSLQCQHRRGLSRYDRHS